jgi:hypothetical protein
MLLFEMSSFPSAPFGTKAKNIFVDLACLREMPVGLRNPTALAQQSVLSVLFALAMCGSRGRNVWECW